MNEIYIVITHLFILIVMLIIAIVLSYYFMKLVSAITLNFKYFFEFLMNRGKFKEYLKHKK